MQEETFWEIVEQNYPNYHNSNEIAEHLDLYRLMFEFYELDNDSAAMVRYKSDYDSDINQVRSAYYESLSDIYEAVIIELARA